LGVDRGRRIQVLAVCMARTADLSRGYKRAVWRYAVLTYIVGFALGFLLDVPLWACLLIGLAVAEPITWHMRRQLRRQETQG
jgi:hypothetical protein